MTDLTAFVEAELARRPGTKTRGDEIDFLCVAHDETNASASWNRTLGVWKCLMCSAKGHTTDLATRLGYVAPPSNVTALPRRAKGVIVATYDYRDSAGGLIFQVVREQPKAFKQRQPDGQGGWLWQKPSVRLVYRLPELLASTGRVYVPEGEKDCDNLAALGLTATCAPEGAGKWKEEHSAFLAGRDVVVLADNDQAGELHAVAVATSLTGVASSVKVLRLPGLPAKGDVSDWIEAQR